MGDGAEVINIWTTFDYDSQESMEREYTYGARIYVDEALMRATDFCWGDWVLRQHFDRVKAQHLSVWPYPHPLLDYETWIDDGIFGVSVDVHRTPRELGWVGKPRIKVRLRAREESST